MKSDDTEIEKDEFHQRKSPVLKSNIDINKIAASNNFTFVKQDFKYFIGYKDNKEVRNLCIFIPDMSIYKRYSDKTKCMYFMIKDETISDKHMTIWEKASNIIKTNFNSELIHNKIV